VQTDSIVDFKVRPGAPNRNYDDARRADKDAYARYWHGMLEAGILLPPSQNEVMFVSVQHTDADIDETIAALAHAVDA
jgi:glutamate-1-semialdehyde 2,1-aminomutase